MLVRTAESAESVLVIVFAYVRGSNYEGSLGSKRWVSFGLKQDLCAVSAIPSISRL